ncbi:LAMI_0E07162g1_1 [Lachancea mirantina]|uniref:LAMI_0E07162g1_1 n=1 Tax=Lachancea mirantina TaxID=1230905 RepID=A0A1G4JMB3_9SACH|nr:LAMI_0E07162g1_1 [Lachancea mirantina]
MSNTGFLVPTNFTLPQTLELLYSIVTNKFKNCEEPSSKDDDLNSLKHMYKSLSRVLSYLRDGISEIEQHFKLESLVNVTETEVVETVISIRILEQDIRNTKLAAKRRLEALENGRRHGPPSSGSHFSLSSLLKKTRLSSSSQRKKEMARMKEEKEAKEVLKLKEERERQEKQELERETAKRRKEEEERAKLLELAVKRQVEREIALQNTSRKEELAQSFERGDDRDSAAVSRQRSSLDVKRPIKRPTDHARRKSVDLASRQHTDATSPTGLGITDMKRTAMNSVNKAAYVAWSQSNVGVERKKSERHQPRAPSEPTSPTFAKPRYEYVKPVIKRHNIRAPTKAPTRRKEALVSSDNGKTGQTVAPRVRAPRERPSSTPSPVASPRSQSPQRVLTPQQKRIQDVMSKLEGVDPDACQQILNDILLVEENIYWDDIAGLSNAKSSLKETVVYPFLRPDLFKGLREPVTGMLLFGPPGTGKSMIAKAVATESRSTFFSISASSLLSKYLGESEKLVRALFYLAKKLSPSIVFVDEIDSLLTARSDNENESSRRIKTEMLIQWSSLSSSTARERAEGDLESGRVLVLAATNLPWAIDEAARRRFSRRLYIPLPEYETRLAHLKKLLQNQKNDMSENDFEIVAKLTKGFSGSDITSLAKEAAMIPIRELGDKLMDVDFTTIRGISRDDFRKAMLTVKRSVAPESLTKFNAWATNFGSTGA